MIVGILTIELFIPESNSLKVKRSAVKSLKDRIQKFNVSVAEVDHEETWQRSALGVSYVSNEQKHVEQVLDRVLRLVLDDYRVQVLDSSVRYV